MDLTAFVQDLKTYDAVERRLERISEASKKLGSLAEELWPEIPWVKLRGLGNLLRHEYDRIDGVRIWSTAVVVTDELGRLAGGSVTAGCLNAFVSNDATRNGNG